MSWPLDTTISRVRITKSILRDKDPSTHLDIIAETMRHNPNITAFHMRPSGAEYSSLLGSLSTRLPSDHARIHRHHMAAHPVDAETPTTLRFTSTKPKPAFFAEKGWYKGAAKRKLFLFVPRQSGVVGMEVSWNVCPSEREQPGVPARPVTAAIQSQATGVAHIVKRGLP